MPYVAPCVPFLSFHPDSKILGVNKSEMSGKIQTQLGPPQLQFAYIASVMYSSVNGYKVKWPSHVSESIMDSSR